MRSLPLTAHNALTAWGHGPFDVFLLALLALLGVWYVRAVRRLEARGRSWPISRSLGFLAGLAAVDIAFQSAVATFSMWDFSSHIVQHVLLMLVAPPLLAMGAPSTLVLQTSRLRVKTGILKLLHSEVFAGLSHPVTVWFLYYGVMFVFFLTPILGFAMAHMDLMDAFNIVFLLGGTLFWWPLVSPDPIPAWRMGHGAKFLILLIGVPFESFLGIALMSERSPAASIYTVSGTHAGGGLLWAVGELAIAIAMLPMYRQWLRSDEREQHRADRRSPDQIGAASGWAAAWQERTGHVPLFLDGPRALTTAAGTVDEDEQDEDQRLWGLAVLDRPAGTP